MCLDIKTNVRKPVAMDNQMENMMDTDNDSDSLKIKRLTGGSLIDYPPLISPDGEYVFCGSSSNFIRLSNQCFILG